MNAPHYHKVGLITIRGGRILLCRKKKATALLILPGGKIERGESNLACLNRELGEELGDVAVAVPEFIGTYRDRAAGGLGLRTVQIELYRGDLTGTPKPSSEIGELVWFGEQDDWRQLAPSLANNILPDLIARGLLPWSGRQASATT